MTIDSPRRRSGSNVKSLHHTIQFMKKLADSKNIILYETESLWLQSASSIVNLKLISEKIKKPLPSISKSVKILINLRG